MRRLCVIGICMLLSGFVARAQVSGGNRTGDRLDLLLQRLDTCPDWLRSRLAMYWTTHATYVYIRGEEFDHAGGPAAPVPTVRFTGIRGTAADYGRPSLEQVRPYDDDAESRVTFINHKTGQMEPAHPSRTGRNIESLNREILNIAADAAERTAATGDSTYLLRITLPVVETYLRGIYHRNAPIDLNHGHQQTLVGMTSMEVIHEDAVLPLVRAYPYIKDLTPYRNELEGGLKKMADLIIANGVPHNNWDLFQAMFVVRIASVLDDDSRRYYLDQVLNHDTVRQWSLPTLANYGFDAATGIWCESPGYSVNVVCDFCDMALLLDSIAGVDLFERIPVLLTAVRALPQYLMPNRMICGFGDTHPGHLRQDAMRNVIRYAQRKHRPELEAAFTDLLRAVQPDAPTSLLAPFVSSPFSVPANSWLMLRSGMDREHDLAISVNGSLGNHQHANGISAEFYGRGYVLGPDAGIGRHLYSGKDYEEYYSQFPAHNTVCVNGVSSYPVMMSHHGFTVVETSSPRLLSEEEAQSDTPQYAVLSFTEPETQAEQQRTLGLVKTSSTGGYYLDIFRSRIPVPASTAPTVPSVAMPSQQTQTEFHDYFYHNLGLSMALTASDGTSLPLQPTQSLAFAGGHLYAYSYIYDQQSACTTQDVRVRFDIEQPNITMNLWMRGDTLREVFRALAPPNMEYERLKQMPYDIGSTPTLTYIARQRGEAWTHPFVAVLQPSSSTDPGDIAQVTYFTPESKDPTALGICITLTNGTRHYIFSSANTDCKMKYQGMKARGRLTILKK